MNGYTVECARSANRELDRLPERIIERATEAIQEFQEDPRPNGSRKLLGSESTYRIWVGQHRVVYEVDDETRTILVTRVRHRKDVYQ